MIAPILWIWIADRMLTLIVQRDGREVARYFLGVDPVLVGRGDNVNLRIDDSIVSKQHARFVPAPEGRISLTDLGSRNGTLVNGRRLRPEDGPVELAVGDAVQLGETTIVIVEDAELGEATTVLRRDALAQAAGRISLPLDSLNTDFRGRVSR